ncbi:hypothetical protein RchiOBHm_Chr1g0358171 [Rosa chinensis]|uniref:Uncharacterized protein n=1 Tax=Rosa chinensis TaxID=74649 RepID=A0A2P6SI12_ROSCH|nr:hypothetical protein RchiOBHm_Chr1g0358171 [Rosa chinensis]
MINMDFWVFKLLVNILTFLAKSSLCLGILICCFRGIKLAGREHFFVCIREKLVHTTFYKCQEQLLFSITSIYSGLASLKQHGVIENVLERSTRLQ